MVDVVDGHRRPRDDDEIVVVVVVVAAVIIDAMAIIPRHVDRRYIQDGTEHVHSGVVGEVANLGRGARGGGDVAGGPRSGEALVIDPDLVGMVE